ncbi:hypothetical protein AVEN_206089-1 [Araneus ventricosus]|uniref:Integrase zinc-binding domain-containing protein n=1 Tax=Araneus ventricosus TaxID=182803 RepID=A0A4Y2N8L1_ARAVE|nr:hypothetical protein AVEN_206089-1 [Araneus ventricosus]
MPGISASETRLVEYLHVLNYHAGTQLLLSIIREKYWILDDRQTVRKIWNACVKCRRFNSKAPTADPVSLPTKRVKDAAVFEVVGVDLIDPLYINGALLYTCALYRALHLELVSSLSTDVFLLSLRRFVARRGIPQIIYSDNGANFIGAYNELAAIDLNEVSRYAEIQRIKWTFIPPTAACQSSTLIRPIQRVFPLELSGNDLTSLPLQKVQLTELSMNSPNPETVVKFPIPDTSVKSPIPDSSKANQPQVTRCGRAMKRPKRLNVVTLSDVFEQLSSSSKRGEDVANGIFSPTNQG